MGVVYRDLKSRLGAAAAATNPRTRPGTTVGLRRLGRSGGSACPGRQLLGTIPVGGGRLRGRALSRDFNPGKPRPQYASATQRKCRAHQMQEGDRTQATAKLLSLAQQIASARELTSSLS